MNKQELIKHIEDLPYKEGPIVDKIDISRKGLLELVNQLDEPGKPVVPPVVSVWYQINKNNLYENIAYLCANWAKSTTYDALFDWMSNTDNFIEILINMHRFGYEVEKEKKYKITLLNRNDGDLYLINQNAGVSDKYGHFSPVVLLFTKGTDFSEQCYKLTKKEVASHDFGWVFDCPGIKIEEVSDGIFTDKHKRES
nr:MAG TPA: Protein of unknown function (DUF1642) [Caudoviricetes sp.]